MVIAKGDAWTDGENDLVVDDYFAMLKADQAGTPYNKAQHNRDLQTKINRGRSSIEFKHQNISAVLRALGEDWIPGYKPAFNFQNSLVDAVLRWLNSNAAWLQRLPTVPRNLLQDEASFWLEPAPTTRNTPPPDELEQSLRIAERGKVAERDERNRTLGRAGEELVLTFERALLKSSGRSDLAEQVVWTSEVEGDGAGYDIASFAPTGESKLIEVKTTNGWERTPFYISSNELSVADARRSEWCLIRVWNFMRQPRAFELRPPLDVHVSLTPAAFRASFDDSSDSSNRPFKC